MTAMAQHSYVGLDERLAAEMREESDKVGSLSIAELRSMFQKNDVGGTNGVAGRSPPTRQAAIKNATSSLEGARRESAVVKGQLQKFERSPPLPLKPMISGGRTGSSSPNTSSLRRISEKVRDVEELLTSHDANLRLEGEENTNCDKKPKPALPVKNPQTLLTKASSSSSSPYKVPKPIVARPLAVLPVTQEIGGRETDKRGTETVVHTSTKNRLRPNASHLSSLISEIQQQQLQQQLHKQQSQWISSAIVEGKETETAAERLLPQQATAAAPPPLPLPRPLVSSRVCSVPSDLASAPRTSFTVPLNPKWKRRSLPSLAELGPAPTKPCRPPKVRIFAAVGRLGSTPPLPQRNPTRSVSVPNVGNPPVRHHKPVPPPPVAPLPAEPCQTFTSFTKESERGPGGSTSPIPEFTEEEELGGSDFEDELYDDTESQTAVSVVSSSSSVSHALHPDEIYHDTSLQLSNDSDELYEDVSVAEKTPSEHGSVTYGMKADDRKKKENDKKIKKLQKENEKKIREIEKLRKKFNLTGNEVAIDTGIVKEATKGRRRDDLGVKKGESIFILRISNNPVGKWLVQNEGGRVGYVDLTNIEVMSQSRVSVVSCDDSSKLYADDENSEEEGIYEEFT